MRLRTLVVLAALPAAAGAQRPEAAPRRPQRPRYTQTLAVNALALPFGLFSAEYERAIGAGFGVGVGGSYLDGALVSRDDDYDGRSGDSRAAWLEGKALYYPGEEAPRGFAIGLTLGYIHVRDESVEAVFRDPTASVIVRQTGTTSDAAATLGVLLDYNWLLGRRRRFLVGTGIGARRVLKQVGRRSDLEQVYPDGRFVVGFAF